MGRFDDRTVLGMTDWSITRQHGNSRAKAPDSTSPVAFWEREAFTLRSLPLFR